MEIVVALALLVALFGGWQAGVFQDRRAAPKPDIDEPFQLDAADDDLGSAFEDYQQSVAEILDRNPQRRDEIVRDLEAATAIWERAEFDAAVKPLRRNLAFRLAIRRASKTKATT
jgi:hypothetical protein